MSFSDHSLLTSTSPSPSQFHISLPSSKPSPAALPPPSSPTFLHRTPPISNTRWFRQLIHRKTSAVDEDHGAVPTPVECYACTQPGNPAFHSTSCGRAQAPQWRAGAGSSLIPIGGVGSLPPPLQAAVTARGPFGSVLDPRSPAVHYTLWAGRAGVGCVGMNRGLAAAGAAGGPWYGADGAHLGHVWMQLRMAYVSRESLVVGCGKLVWDPKMIAAHYLGSAKGFAFDLFVIFPLPQIVFLWVLPELIKEEEIELLIPILLSVFVFQFLPKVYHSICLMRGMQKVTGYIFGTIWWGFGLNLIAYFIASHVVGGCWYLLAIQRFASCLNLQCQKSNSCNLMSLTCSTAGLSPTFSSSSGHNLTASTGGWNLQACLDGDGSFPYGIYDSAPPVVSSNSLAVKILYPVFWGLMTLSTFGNNLEPTSQWLEVIFSIITVLSGLMLFTLLIGNIQVFLHVVMARKRKMQLRCRDMEWWMRRRQLPSRLRQRVRQYERQRWAAMRGEDEMDIIQDLPEGLRRDIKRHLCLELIKKVPLFHNLDDLILDNICDRVKHLVFSKDEKVIREGDPVQRMIFIVHGRLQSIQCLSKGMVATSMLGPGNFVGDELLSWCIRRPFIDRLPPSSATFECAEPTEAFSLEAHHLKYITEHFRYRFANERLNRTARYYSSNWRTWAAVNIQLAWRRYKKRSMSGADITIKTEDHDRRLRLYAAMFMSIRPHDHLE
ncbi:cyclic nucleotide-gated ion channel 2-like [Phalaenopsis equestris]|uniref:cyclic nucleotide-gated ion channel 2-like n=1 Tax=Phalaenopsis equestris TaxID=78828 RepID=UPI0009E3DFD2|nr:cyclic nucleotide-gated ion channel 2-like [Phalaenopsis equestris]